MISKNKMRYIETALAALKLSNYSIPVGAVIVKNGKVLSIGFNKVFNTNEIRLYKGKKVRSIHAELMAIVKARTDLEGASLYVASVKKDGSFRLSRPCDVCMMAIKESGIKEVYYTDYNNTVKREKLR